MHLLHVAMQLVPGLCHGGPGLLHLLLGHLLWEPGYQIVRGGGGYSDNTCIENVLITYTDRFWDGECESGWDKRLPFVGS